MTILEFTAEIIKLLAKFQTGKREKKLFLDWFDEFVEMVNNEHPPF